MRRLSDSLFHPFIAFLAAIVLITASCGKVEDPGASSETSPDQGFVNENPTITSIADKTTPEDTALTVDFVISDPNSTASSLNVNITSSDQSLVPDSNITLDTSTPSNPSITIDPSADQTGSTTISITVTDGEGGSASRSFTLTVTPVNDAPELSTINPVSFDEDSSMDNISFTITDIDSDPSSFTISLYSSDTSIVQNSDLTSDISGDTGYITVVPLANANGVLDITVDVSDGQDSGYGTFEVTVNAVNDAPVFLAGISDQSSDEDTTIGPVTVQISDIETAAADLDITADSDDQSVVIQSIATGGSGQNRTLTLTPTANDNGSATITVTVADEEDATADTDFTVTFTPVNDAPVITFVTSVSSGVNTNEDQTSDTIQFTVTDIDTSLASLDVTADASPDSIIADSGISLVQSQSNLQDWSVRLRPVTDQWGSTVVTITASDQSFTVDEQFDLTVVSVNDAPTLEHLINSTEYTNQAVSYDVTVDDIEDGTNVTLEATSDNLTLFPNGSIVVSGTGASRTITLTPADISSDSAQITITVYDTATPPASSSYQFTLGISTCDSNASGSILNDAIFSPASASCGTVNNDVTITSGTVVTWDGTGSPFTGDIYIEDGGTLQITGAGTLSGNLELKGGTLDIDNDVTLSGLLSLTSDSTVDVAGTYQLTYSNNSSDRNIDVGDNRLIFSGAGDFDNQYGLINLNDPESVLNITGTGHILGNVRLAYGLLDVDNSTSIEGALTHVNDATIDIQAPEELYYSNANDVVLGAVATLTIAGGGDLRLNGALYTDLVSSVLSIKGPLNIIGPIKLGDGTMDVNESFVHDGSITINSDPKLDVASGKFYDYEGADVSVDSGDTLYLSGTGAFDANLQLNGGTLAVTDSFDLSGDILLVSDSNIAIQSGVLFDYTGSAINVGTNTLTFTGAGRFNNSQAITLNSATSKVSLEQTGATVSLVTVSGVDINSGYGIDVSQDASIDTLTLGASAYINLAAGKNLTVANTLSVPGSETLATTGTGTLTLDSGLTVNAGSIIDIPVGATLDLSSATLTFGNDVTIDGELVTDTSTDFVLAGNYGIATANAIEIGDISFAGSVFSQNSATTDVTIDAPLTLLTNEGITSGAADLTLSGLLTMTDGNFSSTGGTVTLQQGLDLSGDTFQMTGGTLITSGTIQKTGGTLNLSAIDLTLSSNLSIDSDATVDIDSLTLDGNTLTLTGSTPGLAVTDNVSVSNGESIVTGSSNFTTNGSLTIDDATFSSSDGTISVFGDLWVTGSTGSTTLTGGILDISSAIFCSTAPFYPSGAELRLSASASINSSLPLTFSGLELDNYELTLSNSSDLLIAGDVTFDGTTDSLVTQGADVSFDGNLIMTNGSITSTAGAVILEQGGTLTGGSISLSSSTLQLTGTVTDNGSVLDTASATLKPVGSATLTSLSDVTVDTLDLNNSLLTLGSSTSNLHVTTTSDLTLDSTSDRLATGDASFYLTGAMVMSDGTFSSTSGLLQVNGTVTGGTFSVNDSTVDLSGDLALESPSTLTSNSGTAWNTNTYELSWSGSGDRQGRWG